MRHLFHLFSTVLLTAAFAAQASPSESSASVTTNVSDTLKTTRSGHSYIVPAAWAQTTTDKLQTLTAPDGEAEIVLFESDTTDLDTALTAAWTAYSPANKPVLQQSSDRPLRNGWQQIRALRYEANKVGRLRSAQAFRAGDRWTILLADLTQAAAEKRDSQLSLIYGRFTAKGFTRESFAKRTALLLNNARAQALRDFVESTRQQFNIPGVAVGVIQNGKTIIADGFGVREIGKPEKIDAETLFLTASVTKPLTTLMLAKLVDQDKFSWQSPVSKVLPTFKLADAQRTAQLQMKHLVCACTGMPRQDMEWIFASENSNAATIIKRLQTMKPTAGLGELYQYSNIMAATAGYTAAHTLYPDKELGEAYDTAMQTQVFDPLQMHATTFNFAQAQRGNFASPHELDWNENPVLVSMDINYTSYSMRPDGGVWSNINDLLRYAQMELSNGLLPDGQRYIKAENLLVRRQPQVAIAADVAYGMGLKIDNTLGTPMIYHGGTMSGYVAEVLWFPEHNVASVILINNSFAGIPLRSLFRRRLVEVLFDGNREAETNVAIQHKRLQSELRETRESLSITTDEEVFNTLSNRYHSEELGEIRVIRKDDRIWFDFGAWQSEVATRKNKDGALIFVTISPGKDGYEFTADTGNNAQKLLLRDAQHEYVFLATKTN